MATIKSHTDLPQSKKLAEILSPESADMYYEDDISVEFGHGWHEQHIPCWSLAALLDVLPCGSTITSRRGFVADKKLYFCNCVLNTAVPTNYDNPVDACYEMILKLHELKML